MAAFLSAHYILSRTPVSNKLVKESQAATEDIYFVGICRRHRTVPLFSPILRYPRCSALLVVFGGNHLKLNLSKTELLFILGKDSKSQSRTSQYRLRHLQRYLSVTRRTVQCPQHNRCGPILQISPLKYPQLLVQALVISCLDHCNLLWTPNLCD